jgi:hypothetical protein
LKQRLVTPPIILLATINFQGASHLEVPSHIRQRLLSRVICINPISIHLGEILKQLSNILFPSILSPATSCILTTSDFHSPSASTTLASSRLLSVVTPFRARRYNLYGSRQLPFEFSILRVVSPTVSYLHLFPLGRLQSAPVYVGDPRISF